MSMSSKVIIDRNVRLDEQVLMLERSRPTRRASIPTPHTPNQSSLSPQSTRSAPNTPKSVASILKNSKMKPFTLFGPKRPQNSVSQHLAPITTAENSSPSAITTPQPSTSGLGQVTDERTDVPTSAYEDDEFYAEILELNDDQEMYMTDDEDEQ